MFVELKLQPSARGERSDVQQWRRQVSVWPEAHLDWKPVWTMKQLNLQEVNTAAVKSLCWVYSSSGSYVGLVRGFCSFAKLIAQFLWKLRERMCWLSTAGHGDIGWFWTPVGINCTVFIHFQLNGCNFTRFYHICIMWITGLVLTAFQCLVWLPDAAKTL